MPMKKGFTLVELSIVLVVIGLLTGGILVGQSLIASSELGAFTRQIQQYDANLALFKDRFRGIPGDTNRISYSGTHGGRANDGWVESRGGDDNHFENEVAYFWQDFSVSGMLKEEYSFTTGSGIISGENVPQAKMGNDAGIVVCRPDNVADPFYNVANVYWISDLPESGVNTWGGVCSDCKYAFTPSEALSVDVKMDDGLQNSGDVRGAGRTEFGPAAAACVTGSAYDVDRDDLVCSLIIRTLSQVGQ